MIDKALTHLRAKIDDKITQLQEHVSYGNVPDFAEYKKLCGEVQGLLTARSYINDLQERLKDSDDE